MFWKNYDVSKTYVSILGIILELLEIQTILMFSCGKFQSIL
jgi:hypothetical protein